MPQMNLPMKQKQTHRHREQTCGCPGGREEGWTGSLGLADAASIYRMDKQQGPAAEHRKPCSISWDKP